MEGRAPVFSEETILVCSEETFWLRPGCLTDLGGHFCFPGQLKNSCVAGVYFEPSITKGAFFFKPFPKIMLSALTLKWVLDCEFGTFALR